MHSLEGGRGWTRPAGNSWGKARAVDRGSEVFRSFVLKWLCLWFTVKLWTSHLVSGGHRIRRGRQRWYLRALLAWTFSGSNRNQSPEQLQSLVSNTFHTHRHSPIPYFADPMAPAGPLFLILGPYTPPTQTLSVLMLPRDPTRTPSRRYSSELALRNNDIQIRLPLRSAQNHV